MSSVFKKSVPAVDFVFLCDEPLGDGLDSVIAGMKVKYQIYFML